MDFDNLSEKEYHYLVLGIVSGLIAAKILIPILLKIPHYAWASLKNLYLDCKQRGFHGTIKYRAQKPKK